MSHHDPHPLEREIKLRFPDAGSARAAVAATGATLVKAKRLQQDRLLDTAAGLLRDARSVLRLRIEPDASFITFKGPVLPSSMKLREELETTVGDGPLMLTVLESLGFQVWFRYEKQREEFRLGDALVAIDDTPIGTFVEIEGSEHAVHDAAAALGRTTAEYVTASYRSLYVDHQSRHGLPVADMLFGHE